MFEYRGSTGGSTSTATSTAQPYGEYSGHINNILTSAAPIAERIAVAKQLPAPYRDQVLAKLNESQTQNQFNSIIANQQSQFQQAQEMYQQQLASRQAELDRIAMIQASPNSSLAKFTNLPLYKLLYGWGAQQADPFTSPVNRFRFDPGYQFSQDEGMRQIQRNYAAKGLLNSGPVLRELTQFGQGLADQNYQRYLGQVGGLFEDYQNRLQGLTQLGAGFAGSGAQQAGQAKAGIAQQTGQNISSLFGNQGTTGLGAFLNTGAAQASNLLQGASIDAQLQAAQAAADAQKSSAMIGGISSIVGGLLGAF